MPQEQRTYDVGTTVRVEADFRVDGNLTDPSEVRVRVRQPDGTEQSNFATKVSQGRYSYRFVVNMPGYWHYRFEGFGGAAGVEEGTFKVRKSQFT